MFEGPWRKPAAESVDLYPGLVVCDDRVTGSITVSRSRLPLWAFVGWLPEQGWEEVVRNWDYIESEYGWTADKMGRFLYDLLEARGEFARLLLVIADAERRERVSTPWWETKLHRKRIAAQLRRCLAIVESPDNRRSGAHR